MKKKKKPRSQRPKVNKKYSIPATTSLSGKSTDKNLFPSSGDYDHKKKLKTPRRLFTSQLFPALDESFVKQMDYSEKKCCQDKGIL